MALKSSLKFTATGASLKGAKKSITLTGCEEKNSFLQRYCPSSFFGPVTVQGSLYKERVQQVWPNETTFTQHLAEFLAHNLSGCY